MPADPVAFRARGAVDGQLGYDTLIGEFVSRLSLGDGVIDVGCNDGTYAVKFAEAVGPTGYVLAVDPGPVAVEDAKKRGARLRHLHIQQVAVTGREDVRQLHLDSKDTKCHSLWPQNAPDYSGKQIAVQAVTLDRLAARVPNLKAIKVDVQGAESEVLAGATETLKRQNLIWYVELWAHGLRTAGSSVADVARTFAAAGYHPLSQSWAAVIEQAERKGQWGSVDEVITHAMTRC